MTYDSTIVPKIDDSEINFSEIYTSSHQNPNAQNSFDFDLNSILDGHFRLAALRSLIELYQNPKKTSSYEESLGKFGHGRLTIMSASDTKYSK